MAPTSPPPHHHPTWATNLLTFCVETYGPTNELHSPSILRAELRAAIAALEHTDLADEGWSRITVASHSYDLVEGITKHIAGWQQQDKRSRFDQAEPDPPRRSKFDRRIAIQHGRRTAQTLWLRPGRA